MKSQGFLQTASAFVRRIFNRAAVTACGALVALLVHGQANTPQSTNGSATKARRPPPQLQLELRQDATTTTNPPPSEPLPLVPDTESEPERSKTTKPNAEIRPDFATMRPADDEAPDFATMKPVEVAPDFAIMKKVYLADALTNRVRLEKPLYSDGPCSESRLRAAALAGDGYAASLCDGASDAEREFWRRLAATNGWVPAQMRLAKTYEDTTDSALKFRFGNGPSIQINVPSGVSVDAAKTAMATDFPGAVLLDIVRRSASDIERDRLVAKYWREKAAAALPKLKAVVEQKDPRALYALSVLCAAGDLVPSNSVLSAELERQAADLGLAAAQVELGRRCDSQQTNLVETAQWYYRAATQGLVSAQSTLSSLHGTPFPFSFDRRFHARASESARWAFEAGHQAPCFSSHYACLQLAEKYQEGSGVESNRTEAVRWFRRAADMGMNFGGDAEYDLALCYFGGDGVAQSDENGLRWLHISQERGHEEYLATERRLAARAYSSGNYLDALKYWRKLAVQGEARAQESLGFLFERGQGVEKDLPAAILWYRRSAEQGLAEAKANLGGMYMRGEGTPKDEAAALRWLKEAAQQGNAQGQQYLGAIYAIGEGVPRDYVEAYKWSNLAAAQGDAYARTNRDRLSRWMTRDQIAEAQRRSAAFVARTADHQDDASIAPDFDSMRPSDPKASGTAFFITEDGYLLTSAHVVAEARTITVQTKQTNLTARLVKADKANDVAVLKVSGRFRPLSLAPSRTVKLGDTVFTLGFPNTAFQGHEPKLTRGEVNSLAGLQDDPRHFQISVAVQPGNSGGPLVDRFGNVVGVVTLRLDDIKTLLLTGSIPQTVNYAVKSSFILAFLETIPDLADRLPDLHPAKDRKSDDVIQEVQQAVALVLVY